MPLIASLQLGTVLIIVVLVALPVGALVFAMGAGNALQKIGKGDFALEQDFPQSSQRPGPRGLRRGARGGDPPDGPGALRSRRGQGPGGAGRRCRGREAAREWIPEVRAWAPTAALREEVRQLVVARNERRQRQGKEPLDVEREIERQLRDLENLGQ